MSIFEKLESAIQQTSELQKRISDERFLENQLYNEKEKTEILLDQCIDLIPDEFDKKKFEVDFEKSKQTILENYKKLVLKA